MIVVGRRGPDDGAPPRLDVADAVREAFTAARRRRALTAVGAADRHRGAVAVLPALRLPGRRRAHRGLPARGRGVGLARAGHLRVARRARGIAGARRGSRPPAAPSCCAAEFEAAALDRELGGPAAARRDLDAVVAARGEVAAGRVLGDAELARVAVALTDPGVRDAALGWARRPRRGGRGGRRAAVDALVRALPGARGRRARVAARAARLLRARRLGARRGGARAGAPGRPGPPAHRARRGPAARRARGRTRCATIMRDAGAESARAAEGAGAGEAASGRAPGRRPRRRRRCRRGRCGWAPAQLGAGPGRRTRRARPGRRPGGARRAPGSGGRSRAGRPRSPRAPRSRCPLPRLHTRCRRLGRPASPRSQVQREQVGLGEVVDVDVVAHAGAVRGRPVVAVDLRSRSRCPRATCRTSGMRWVSTACRSPRGGPPCRAPRRR